MQKQSFSKIIIPSLTVFFSSACIMIIELVASRLIARHLGSSLYTWTSVIGVVLAGITIGNYMGGRIADKFQPKKALSALFCLASIACIIIIILNNIVGEWIWLWHLSWPVRVFTHITLVFLLPSVLLGTISPVVAKMALDRGLPPGRTVGDIYAFGAAGSIAGTFLAGFYLIAAMGTISIIWSVAFFLLLLAIIYQFKAWPLYIWAAILILFFFLGYSEVAFAQSTGSAMLLREKPNPNILYQDETPYCYVAVKQISEEPDHRLFLQDKLKHSEILMDDIDDLKYFHTVVFSCITKLLSEGKEKISTFSIGGGGYVFPQYIEKNWPGSRIDVAEIDPGVTQAAIAAFGLKENSSINTFHLDARNYVDSLLTDRKAGKQTPLYDFIYEDAFSDYNVPFQLVTKEFNDKIYDILKEDGVYMINLIDVMDKATFLSAYLNTLQQTFPHLYIVTENAPESFRITFSIIASKVAIDVEGGIRKYNPDFEYRYLDSFDTKQIALKANNLILTDDFAPAENLLTPVVKQSAIEFLTHRYRTEANASKKEGNLSEAIESYHKMIQTDFAVSVEAWNEIGILYAQLGNREQSIEAFRQAIKANEIIKPKGNMANVHFSLAVALQSMGQQQQALDQFNLAIQGFQLELDKNPNSVKYLTLLGDSYASIGEFLKASEYFSKAVNKDPLTLGNHMKWIQSIEYAGQTQEAIEAAKRSLEFFLKNGNEEYANYIQRYLQHLQNKK